MNSDQREAVMVLITATVTLLIEKGVFTMEEWDKEMVTARRSVDETVAKEG